MKNLMMNEWQKIKLPFCVTMLLSIIAVSATTLIVYKSYALEAQLEVYEVGFTIFNLFYPILAVIPTAWLMYFERKTNFMQYMLPRVKLRNYLLSKGLVSMLTGFGIVFTMSLVSVVIAVFFVPPVIQTSFAFNTATGEPIEIKDTRLFGEVFVNQPFLYGFVLSVWKGLIGSLMALFGFILSLYSRNLFVILSGPFIYMILDNFFWGFLELYALSLVTAFEPSTVFIETLSWHSFVVSPALMLFVMISYGLYSHVVVKKTIYEL